MIRGITISRASIVSSTCDPVQLSENQQLAVNNGYQLTLLDPKLPLIHQSTVNSSLGQDNKGTSILESKRIFDISGILDVEAREKLSLGNLDKILIETLDEEFSFGRINEPIIVNHAWSPVNPTSRDCLLGVLYNTSELLLLERQGTNTNDYVVKYNVFDELLKNLGISPDVFTNGEYTLSKMQYMSLKVESFCFNKIVLDFSPQALLSIGLADRSIEIYFINDQFHKAIKFSTEGTVVAQRWSNWNISDGSMKSHLAVLYSDNSVSVFEIHYDDKSRSMKIEHQKQVLKSSRFSVGKFDFTEIDGITYLLIVNTISIHVFRIGESLSTDVRNFSLRRDSNAFVVGMFPIQGKDGTFDVVISLENGEFECFELNVSGESFKRIKPPGALEDFISKTLYKYQLKNSRQDGLYDNNENSTKHFLNNTVEGEFINYGCRMNSNGMITIVYRIIPKQALNYTISSKLDYNIGFVSLSDDFVSPSNDLMRGTSLSFLNRFWLKEFSNIPRIPRFTGETKEENIASFVNDLVEFKHSRFSKVDDIKVITMSSKSFKQSLYQNVLQNMEVKELEIIYNFNLIILKAFDALIQLAPSSEILRKAHANFVNEQKVIEKIILNHVMATVLDKYKTPDSVESNIDKFVLTTFSLLLGKDYTQRISSDEEYKFTFKTKFIEESFNVSSNYEVGDEFFELVNSETNHKWPRCKLTFLPIMDIHNKIDELGIYSYLSDVDELRYTEASKILCETLDFCIFTGNKKYKVNLWASS
ncbi:Piso0_001929 [Millerozyma farinosa CBS 7064]|uniref:Piso0_001929 protein n=1 Tax=Pichia sorbitophila (strain ATCC MYA-4447 / BCRC 22081 / CBS 7064 / NBRC 10061 / NRRL Y-12695) TaxID=559304 RepID=G8YM28_PICSO|nr:Piso0_001929 [Millerozyma farinosa CBS 7064]